MSLGDVIALTAVSINALFYFSGLFKLNATVEMLTQASSRMEKIVDKISERLSTTEVSLAQIENQCKIFHGQENVQ